MFQAEDQCDQNLIGWLKESKAFIMPSGTAFKNHLEIQYLLETATSCYGQSLLVAYWYLEASSLRPYKVNQKNIKEHMHGSRGLPWAVFAVIKPGSFIGAGQKRSSEDLQLRKDNLKASLSPIFIVQIPIAWGAVDVATSGSLMNSKTHEFVELSTALFSWAYTHGSCEYL